MYRRDRIKSSQISRKLLGYTEYNLMSNEKKHKESVQYDYEILITGGKTQVHYGRLLSGIDFKMQSIWIFV